MGRMLVFFPGKCKISKITMCWTVYLAVNCPKPIPQPHFVTFTDHCFGGSKSPSIFTLLESEFCRQMMEMLFKRIIYQLCDIPRKMINIVES